jgi:hypothetical protein
MILWSQRCGGESALSETACGIRVLTQMIDVRPFK